MNKKLLLIPIVLLATTGVTLAFGLSKEKKITIDEIYSPKLTTVENKQPVKNKQITNILIAGIGGENHDGGMLTDTIIFTSIDMQNNKIATLNIPRDLYIDLGDKYGYNKINSANAFGEQEKPGSGMLFLQNEVEKILNQDIDYYIRIDFDGFKDIIDTLGGITINVERSFVDNQYPTENFGYKTIYFQAGPQVMNGERALEYTRSRHGTNGEGSDFARSKRQQQVIEAVKDKILSEINTYNPTKIISIFDALKRHISTNLSYKDIYNLYKIADNLIVDYIRSNKYQANLEDDSDLEKIETDNPVNDVSQKLNNFIDSEEISKALEKLNEKYKKLLIMRFIDELEIDEICQILNKSRGAINVAIHRALKTLRENLENEKNERKL